MSALLDAGDPAGEGRPAVRVTTAGPPPPLGAGAARALLALLVAADGFQRDVTAERDNRAAEHERSA